MIIFNSMQKVNTFPLFSVAIKFYNHPEMMVRNAIRIIALTVFKLNDDKVNSLLQELPICSYFVNLACLFRDKILDLE
jgi:protein CLEC16A